MTAHIHTGGRGWIVTVFNHGKYAGSFTASSMLEVEVRFSKYMEG
jgi:hypothetical protein